MNIRIGSTAFIALAVASFSVPSAARADVPTVLPNIYDGPILTMGAATSLGAGLLIEEGIQAARGKQFAGKSGEIRKAGGAVATGVHKFFHHL